MKAQLSLKSIFNNDGLSAAINL